VVRTITQTDFENQIKELKKRFGEVQIIDNEDGSKTVMIVSRNKHAGTFRVK